MPLIDPRPTMQERQREAARATRCMAADAMRNLPLADLCDLIEAEVSRRADGGLRPDDAARLTTLSHEIGGIAWRDLVPGK